jgi:UDP-2,4-diacetamido-2,4,6-trideoxy-beta-L-altropyranose hydrolase
MGAGHMMRCLALADGLRRPGTTIRFLSRQLPEHLRTLIAASGHELSPLDDADTSAAPDELAHAAWLGTSQADDAMQSARALGDRQWDWLVVDHYALDERWETAMRRASSRILAIDDLADRRHDCDALLDQNVVDADPRYGGKVPSGATVLLGPRYALLRDEFREARRRSAPRAGAVSRVLVSFGGSDADDWTGLALDAVTASVVAGAPVDVVIGANHPRRARLEAVCAERGFSCHVQTTRMAALMVSADLAIGASGSSTWERCCVGLPALAVAAADNQRLPGRSAALAGLSYLLDGDRASIDAATLAGAINLLARSPSLREMYSRNGMRSVDGAGVDRLVRLMDRGAVRVRPATPADADALFAWRNHESVRRHTFGGDLIERPVHDAWMQATLNDSTRLLLIGERQGEPVGVIRFDLDGDAARISIYVVPGLTDRGLGSRLLASGAEWLKARRPEVASLVADVRADNEASHRLFGGAGFSRVSTTYRKSVAAS